MQVLASPAAGLPSYTLCATAYPSPLAMRGQFSLYAPDQEHDNPLLCPLAADDLTRLPPALILSSERDVLRDEAEAYAAKLQAAGCETQSMRVRA